MIKKIIPIKYLILYSFYLLRFGSSLPLHVATDHAPLFAWPNPWSHYVTAGSRPPFAPRTLADDAPSPRLSVPLSPTSPPHPSQPSERPYFGATWRRPAWRGAIRYVSASCKTAWGAKILWTCSRISDDPISVYGPKPKRAPRLHVSTLFSYVDPFKLCNYEKYRGVC